MTGRAWEHRCGVCGQTVCEHSGLCPEMAGAEWHNHCCPGCPCLSWRETHVRVQRRRVKGWRMPEGAVYVGRGSRWGNPFRLHKRRMWSGGFTYDVWDADLRTVASYMTPEQARQVAATRFVSFLAEQQARGWEDYPDPRGLVGKVLCCWCPVDGPCHADALWEVANGELIPNLVTAIADHIIYKEG